MQAGPDATHKLYDAFASTWETVRDCVAGARAVKERGEKYLPKLSGQSIDSYNAYKARAVFLNACGRTLDAMVGFIFRHNPEVKVPEDARMAELLADADLRGNSFYDVQRDTIEAVLSVGRRITVIDWHEMEARPFLLTYETEDVVNWRVGRIKGRTLLTLLVLRETSPDWIAFDAAEAAPSRYEGGEYEQYRIYELLQDSDDSEPYLRVSIERKVVDEWRTVEQCFPARGGISLHRIPAVAHGPDDNDFEPRKVPLSDIAELNVAHYQTSADHRNALHVAGVPTPCFFGFPKDANGEVTIRLGPNEAIVTDNADASASYLSYSAEGAAPLSEEMDKLERRMASLGARIFERQSSGGAQEAYETVLLRYGADSSALLAATMANSRSLTLVLQWMYWWEHRNVEEPEHAEELWVELNKKFVDVPIDAAAMREVWALYIGGGISYETFFAWMQHGGIISSERTIEEERAAIQNAPIAVPAGTPDDETEEGEEGEDGEGEERNGDGERSTGE